MTAVSKQDVETHFRFGENWRSFNELFSEDRLNEAIAGLKRLFPEGELVGRDFVDIGSGSGLSSLAALRLGAKSVTALDIDPDSVRATTELLSKHAPDSDWSASNVSIFDYDPGRRFDVVYSWGVLHHTGAMWDAISKAARLVDSEGVFALAIYHKTPACGLWKLEKRMYKAASPALQRATAGIYKGLWKLKLRAAGQNPSEFESNYKGSRGMDWDHDIHDWLGGYPYESATPDEIKAAMARMNFRLKRAYDEHKGKTGLFGTECSEFVFERS